jgi:hypothetical protein
MTPFDTSDMKDGSIPASHIPSPDCPGNAFRLRSLATRSLVSWKSLPPRP